MAGPGIGIEPPSAVVRVGRERCHPSVSTRHVRNPHRVFFISCRKRRAHHHASGNTTRHKHGWRRHNTKTNREKKRRRSFTWKDSLQYGRRTADWPDHRQCKAAAPNGQRAQMSLCTRNNRGSAWRHQLPCGKGSTPWLAEQRRKADSGGQERCNNWQDGRRGNSEGARPGRGAGLQGRGAAPEPIRTWFMLWHARRGAVMGDCGRG